MATSFCWRQTQTCTYLFCCPGHGWKDTFVAASEQGQSSKTYCETANNGPSGLSSKCLTGWSTSWGCVTQLIQAHLPVAGAFSIEKGDLSFPWAQRWGTWGFICCICPSLLLSKDQQDPQLLTFSLLKVSFRAYRAWMRPASSL